MYTNHIRMKFLATKVNFLCERTSYQNILSTHGVVSGQKEINIWREMNMREIKGEFEKLDYLMKVVYIIWRSKGAGSNWICYLAAKVVGEMSPTLTVNSQNKQRRYM